MPKRYRAPVAKPGQLKVQYGKVDGEPDLYYCYGGGGATCRDSKMLAYYFFETRNKGQERNLREELEHRGYDITTLKFTIMKKQDGNVEDEQER